VTGRTLALDLDGTLLDCRPRQVLALDAVLGQPYGEPEAFWEAKRAGATTREALIALGMAESLADGVAQRWRVTVEDDELLLVDTVLPDVERALATARSHVDRLTVITARRRGDAVRSQCERLGLIGQIDDVLTVDPVSAAEHKAVVLSEISAIGFIGDTASDARAAAAAGLPFAAVTTGQHTREVLQRTIDAPVVDSLSEAVSLVLGQPG
jgi:phosphoglycolate phosphatase